MEFLTTAEVADLLRAPVDTVRYWRQIGSGPPAAKVGRRVLYPRAGVEKWVASKFEGER